MSGRRVIAVAHFPPPVHGMAVAVDRLVSELETLTAVRRVNIAAPGLDRSPTYHLVRVMRVIRALAILSRERRRTSQAFFSCDAGAGMVYTLLLTVWARLCGYRTHLQHHSYAYVDRRSALLALLVRLTGDRCTHLVTCHEMETGFLAAYPRAATRVVGVATALEFGRSVPEWRPRLVLGFLGNVTVDKGIDLALSAARAAVSSGLPIELRVAGPVVDPAAVALLDDAVREPDLVVTRVGPVYGEDRTAFLGGLDVFLFPSRYHHESFGLVAWEAMAMGVPVLAHRAGCLTAEALGGAGQVIDRAQDYVAPTAGLLERWWRSPDALRAAGVEAYELARSVAAAATSETSTFCTELAGRVPAEQTTIDHGRS